MVENPDRLPRARLIRDVPAPYSGWIAAIDAAEVGLTAVDLGAGRAKKGDRIDPAVGIVIHCQVGIRVEQGDKLLTIHADDEAKLQAAEKRLLEAIEWSGRPEQRLPLFYGVVE